MPVFSPEEIVETFEMISLSHLNVRAVTLGLNLLDCIQPDFEKMASRVREKIVRISERLVTESEEVENRYGVPIVNKRIAVTPAALLLESAISRESNTETSRLCVKIAKVFDDAAREVSVDFIGGYSALVQKGWTKGDFCLIGSIPEALSVTERVCSCVNIAETRAGINTDAAMKMGEVVKDTARKTAKKNGVGCAKLVTFANAPEDNPFMPGAFHGPGEAEATLNVGISGPGVVRAVVEKHRDLDFRSLADIVKKTAFKITRVGELIGREMAQRLDVRFGIVDLSLAPTPEKGESIAGIIEAMGIESCGAPGSTAALAILTDAVKKGGNMATSFVGGLSGAFIPLSEDSGMGEAARRGSLSIEKLEAMTSVCSCGLDMIPVPGDTPSETIAALIMDEAAIGVLNNKPVGVRIIPVPGKKAGDYVEFGGLFGSSVVIPISRFSSRVFARRGGQIPPPVASLRG